MKRNIIEIDRDLCNGCGLCADACHEGAIKMVDGKAELIHDKYCDGLGDCLPACPTNAIKMIEREAAPYDDDAVKELQKKKSEESKMKPIPCGCPGTMAKKIETKSAPVKLESSNSISSETPKSQLGQWPVQIKLVNPQADYLSGADILIAADCTAYAYANFHDEFIKGRITLIGCPKLDDNKYYEEKLTEIFSGNDINSITVVRMEVPCCSGIISSVKQAMLNSQKIVPYNEITISVDGNRI